MLTNGICYPDSGDSERCRSILSLNQSGEIINQFFFINRLSFGSPRPLQIINDTIYIWI